MFEFTRRAKIQPTITTTKRNLNKNKKNNNNKIKKLLRRPPNKNKNNNNNKIKSLLNRHPYCYHPVWKKDHTRTGEYVCIWENPSYVFSTIQKGFERTYYQLRKKDNYLNYIEKYINYSNNQWANPNRAGKGNKDWLLEMLIQMGEDLSRSSRSK